MTAPANAIRHFAVHAEDVERARRFYEAAFDWNFRSWGPPDFYLIQTGADGDGSLQGALQTRHEALTGAGMRGFECTIGVASLDDAMARVTAAGGQLLTQPYVIGGVGRLCFFVDTEGNRAGLMQYDEPGAPAQ